MQWNSNIGDPIVFWILKTILLFELFYCGYKISNGNKYKKYALISTVFYSLIEGLRWMRGVDYWHYYQDIATNFQAIETTPDPEPIYKLFCTLFYHSQLPVSIAFIFYSAILFISFLSIIKHFKELAIWAMPLFFIITVSATENHIRQFFAIPFILFAYSAWLNNKKKSCYLLLCIAPLIHTSSIILCIIFLLLINTKLNTKLNLPSKGGFILLIIYLALFFTWDINKFGSLSIWLQTLDGFTSSKFSSYVDNSDRWFTKEGSIAEVTDGLVSTSVYMKYITLISSSIIIYYGYKFAIKNKKYISFYILACINLFILVIGGDIELFGRFAEYFLIFIPITISYIITSFKPYKTTEKFLIYSILFIIYFVYMFLRNWGEASKLTGNGFIWDA